MLSSKVFTIAVCATSGTTGGHGLGYRSPGAEEKKSTAAALKLKDLFPTTPRSEWDHDGTEMTQVEVQVGSGADKRSDKILKYYPANRQHGFVELLKKNSPDEPFPNAEFEIVEKLNYQPVYSGSLRDLIEFLRQESAKFDTVSLIL